MELKTSLAALPGIGYQLSQKLHALNLYTVEDLIFHFPFRYEDFSNVSTALEAQVDQKVTLLGEIWSIQNIFTKTRKILTQAIFNDGTTPIILTWFNQHWLTKQIQVGDKLQVSGKLTKYKNKFTIVAPAWEKASTPGVGGVEPQGLGSQGLGSSEHTIHTGRLVPVYPETFGLTSKWLRTKIDQVLPQVINQIPDPLPLEVRGEPPEARFDETKTRRASLAREASGMLEISQAIEKIHFPQSWEDVNKARERLGFDELFFIQLATLKARQDWKAKPTVEKFQISNIDDQISKFLESLPFKLTKAQVKVIGEIREDLQKTQPMNRLVQGEVGSGKTVVAAAIIYLAHQAGYKSLYMAPTEILAFQHFSTLTRLLEPFGIKIGIYTGSKKYTKGQGKNKSRFKSLDSNDSPQVIVGTHALLSDKLTADNIGLIIVDEQQRFGVEQRTILRNKAKVPHFLTMTATPIPRTVALTLYGDLDLSVIDELPKGRIPIRTHVVPNKKREDAYRFITKKIEGGDQVYVITPLIEFSETLVSTKAAKVEFERLQKDIFPQFKLGLLHGRLKSKEKEQVINDFKDKKTQILVSTSVVEVGVDVSNATIMVIEGAERFGLAQLHQLRGRVGRGEKESFCFLFAGQEDNSTISRLKNLEKTSNGLELAELDLKIRGSGEIFGTRQSGRFELKIASFTDLPLLEQTREKAREILLKDPKLENYPQLRLKLAEFNKGVMPD